ncbi:MAG: type II secretion system protein GspC [Archangium sp.]
MLPLIRLSFHALSLLCVACVGLVSAHTVSSVMEAWLQPLPSSRMETQTRTTPEELRTPLALAPLARYLGLPDKVRQNVIPAEPRDEAVPNSLGLKLLGTMVAARPSATFASIYESPANRTRSVWMGGDIRGAKVLAIERNRVMLLNSGRLEYVGPEASTPPAQAAATSTPGISIRQVGPQDYEVSRQDLEASLADPHELIMQARVVPAFRDGAPQGFKLFSLRPGSLYARIGLQNGDVLRRINGLSLDGVERALEAYNKLREASRIELDVERNGQPLRLTYSMR